MPHLRSPGPTKKIPDQHLLIRDVPNYPRCRIIPVRPRGYDDYAQAGLLTPGSSYWLRLPDRMVSDFGAAFVPGYSGGPVSDLHGIPY